jgi:hypothetical protein
MAWGHAGIEAWRRGACAVKLFGFANLSLYGIERIF